MMTMIIAMMMRSLGGTMVSKTEDQKAKKEGLLPIA